MPKQTIIRVIPNHRVELLNENEDQEYLLKRSDYCIRKVNSIKQCIKINTFLKKKYAACGYYIPNTMIYPQHTPYQITFEASYKQETIGTLTLTLDSDKGLLADELYKKEIDTIRSRNRKLCEISKLAFKTSANSKKIMAELFHIAYIYARTLHAATDTVIEVNPRHAVFYKNMLGFQEIGSLRICPRVNAPALLLHLQLEHMTKQISAAARSYIHNKETIYKHFLSQFEEKKLTHKIQSMFIREQFTVDSKKSVTVNQLNTGNNLLQLLKRSFFR